MVAYLQGSNVGTADMNICSHFLANEDISVHPVIRSVSWNLVNGFVRKSSKRFLTVILFSVYPKSCAGIFSMTESCFQNSAVAPGRP